jgi:hypothetical protein
MATTTYIVKSGDSLSKIAAANKTTVSALLEANPKLTTDPKYNGGKTIFSGTTIKIPSTTTTTTTKPTTTTTTATPTPTPTFSPADFRRAEEASMSTVTPATLTPPPIVDERTKLANQGVIAPYFEFSNGYLYYSGIPYSGTYLGVDYVDGSPRQNTVTPPPVTPPQVTTPTITVPRVTELEQLGPITTQSQAAVTPTPALDASKLVGISSTAPAPINLDPQYLLAYADSIAKANALRGRSGLTRDLALEKASVAKERGVREAENALYNARIKALSSLAQRGLYGATGLKAAAQQAAGFEPIKARSEALRQFTEQTNLASRMFEQEQREATEIENQALQAKLKAEELATKLTRAGA